MASYTTNLNLKKPSGSENVAIGDINNNMDTIDQAYGTLNSNLSTKPTRETITIPANGSYIIPFGSSGKRGILSNYSGNNANMGLWLIYITTTGSYYTQVQSSAILSLSSDSTGLKITNSSNNAANVYVIWNTNNDI